MGWRSLSLRLSPTVLLLNAAPIAGRRVAGFALLGSPNHQRPQAFRNAAHGEFLAQRLDQRELRIGLHRGLAPRCVLTRHSTRAKAPFPMTPAARAAAAIEVLSDIEARRRPAADAMKDWGLAHRFAGSGDRAAISGLVYDALRKKSSSGWIMGSPSPRAEILGALRQTRGLDVEAIAALFSGEGHAPAKLTEAERARLAAADLSRRARACRWTISPNGLAPSSRRASALPPREEGRALAERAPVDLRVNLLKATRDKALRALAHLKPEPTPFSPVGHAHRHAPGRARAAARLRPGLRQGACRAAGRRLAARRAPRRSQARHAGPRPLRRRRRQDAGARRRDGKPGPDLRRRPRRASPRADLRAGSRDRARAMCRCGRRKAKPTCSPTSRGAAISC